jgi:hypothetical protein
MNVNNFVWYWPIGGDYVATFLVPFAITTGLALALIFAGRQLVLLRPWVCMTAYAAMPVLGLLRPMTTHFGDPSSELMAYLQQRTQWKTGELLGTFPFYAVGRLVPGLQAATDTGIARALSVGGAVGSLGFFVLAVELARRPHAPRSQWFRFARRFSKTELGYFYLLAFASLPSFLMYAGFIQTTYVANIVLPWSLTLLVRVWPRRMPTGAWETLEARMARQLAAWSAIGVLCLCHGSAIVVMLGAAFAVVGRTVRATWRALRKSPSSSADWVVAMCGVASAFAVLTAMSRLTHWMTMAYPAVYRDPWIFRAAMGESRLLALRAITHAIPRWIPVLGQTHPTCGQQTWFFSRDWMLFAAGSLAHVTSLAPWLAWRARLLFSRAGSGALATRSSLHSPQPPAGLAASAILAAAFIACYSPHFSQPRDMDVIFLAGSVIGVFVIEHIAHSRRGEHASSKRAAGLTAVVAYQTVLLCASWVAQRGLDARPLRGVSLPWC